MKVKCIKMWHSGWWLSNRFEKKYFWSKKKQVYKKGPKYGDTLTVTDEGYYQGHKYFLLKEWPEEGDGFLAEMFVPIEESYEKITFKEIKEKASIN